MTPNPNIYPTANPWLGVERILYDNQEQAPLIYQETHPDDDLIKILRCFPPICNNIVKYVVIYGCLNLHIEDIAVCQLHMTNILDQNCVTCGEPIAKKKYLPWKNDYYERYKEL